MKPYELRAPHVPHSATTALAVHDQCAVKVHDGDTDDSDGSTFTSEEVVLLEPWSLSLGDSIYDEAFIVPLYWKSRRSRRHGGWRPMLHAVVLLALNCFLQVVVLMKVHTLSNRERQEQSEKLWEVCQVIDPEKVHFHRGLGVQPRDGVYMDCGPLSAMLISHPAFLDLDGDGAWTEAEARQVQNEHRGADSEREADMPLVLRNLIALGQRPEKRTLLRQGVPPLTAQDTRNFTSLPMSWLQQEAPLLQLCMAIDHKMCGNLEVRGILKDRVRAPANFPHWGRQHRIALCEQALEENCRSVLGERYKFYTHRKKEICGMPQPEWIEGVSTLMYSKSEEYIISQDGVVKMPYMWFLFVILLIWFAAMLEEVREIVGWWIVIVFKPTKTEDDFITELDGGIQVNAVPMEHKVMTIVLNLIPRSMICTALVFVGTKFLIRADDYNDLILNSVALGFLIEVDNMLFNAVVSDLDKSILRKTEPVTVARKDPRDRSGGTMQTFMYTMAIIVCVAAFEFQSYFAESGKFVIGKGYICLCQAAGYHCAAAQALGGAPHLPGFEDQQFTFWSG